MSRTAAIFGLVLYIIEKIYMMIIYGIMPNFMIVIFTMGFINGIRGTFAYHKLKKQAESAGQSELQL